MRRAFYSVLLSPVLIGLVLVGYAASSRQAPEPPLERIAFGSCNNQELPQPLWEPIQSHDPGLWIWLGDNIYADTKDMALMDSLYTMQYWNPGYAALRQQTPVIGTWDDHDYGTNDAGRRYAKRDRSQQLFLDFLGVPQDDPRRLRRGVYSAHTFGPAGRRVKVILLDTRYHRDGLTPDTTSEQLYQPNPNGDVLGQAQWTWLEDELRSSDAQIHLIGTSIQALPEEHAYEKWSNFPKARQRLFDVIRRSDASGVILLSGDRHFAELSRRSDVLDYPLYELTVGALTHHGTITSESNRYRVGGLHNRKNFGLITIDWDADPATITLQVRGEDDRTAIDQTIDLDALQPKNES